MMRMLFILAHDAIQHALRGVEKIARVPFDEEYQYSTWPTVSRIRTSRPVSSRTSRRAVCSSVSPALGVPFGSAQRRSGVRPTRTISMPSSARRNTMPPADTAV